MDRCAWRPLPATHSAVPPLLVSASFGPSSYSVHVTDLVHVWSETLSRREICLRALRDDTPIDPTCDAEQMGVLLAELGKVAEADAAVQMRLEPATGDGTGDDLRLGLTCALPAPLPPLRWTFCLRLQPPATIAAALVLPLLRDRRDRRREAAFLTAVLRDKDAVIARLADKLDTLGAGMETAFPGVARRGGGSSGSGSGRPVSREVLEERVRGLAPFDAQKRKRDDSADTGDDGTSSTDLADLLGEELAGEVDMADTPADIDCWWQRLGDQRGVQLVSGRQTDAAQDDESKDARDTADDAFDNTNKTGRDEDAASTDNDKVDRLSSPAPVTPKKPNPPAKAKLGRLGGKKKALTPPPPESPKETAASASDTASETGDDTGSEALAAEEPKSSPIASQVPMRPPRHGGLGRIGKGKAELKSSTLGRIGKASSRRTGTPPVENAEEGIRKPVETEADKAKQQERLQNVVKQNAAPVRKKRKF